MDRICNLFFIKICNITSCKIHLFCNFSNTDFIRYFFKSARKYRIKVKCRFHFVSSNRDLLYQYERWINPTRGMRK